MLLDFKNVFQDVSGLRETIWQSADKVSLSCAPLFETLLFQVCLHINPYPKLTSFQVIVRKIF